jgi:hypothetical protein
MAPENDMSAEKTTVVDQAAMRAARCLSGAAGRWVLLVGVITMETGQPLPV